jgi:hypothetical protein
MIKIELIALKKSKISDKMKKRNEMINTYEELNLKTFFL